MNELKFLLLAWNITVALIYGADKMFARQGKRRIRENTLILSAFLLGGVGAMFGMILFNHKTSKIKFRILVPVSAIIMVFIVTYIFKTNGGGLF